jgi:hypothetical protein
MSLLAALPDLQSISTALIGHANAGDDLASCISAGNTYPYYYDSFYYSRGGQASFGKYGMPVHTVSPMGLNWAYNSTAWQTFSMQTNHTAWKFWSSNDITGWTVEVWDSANTTKLGNYDSTTLWDSNATIRVKPNATNGGTSDKYLTLYCATFNDYAVTDGYCTCDQACQLILPTLSVFSNELTITGFSYTMTPGSSAVYLTWTPNGMATSPHENYLTVTKPGPIVIFSNNRPTCINGVQVSSYLITLTEAVQYNTNYLLEIEYDNV